MISVFACDPGHRSWFRTEALGTFKRLDIIYLLLRRLRWPIIATKTGMQPSSSSSLCTYAGVHSSSVRVCDSLGAGQ